MRRMRGIQTFECDSDVAEERIGGIMQGGSGERRCLCGECDILDWLAGRRELAAFSFLIVVRGLVTETKRNARIVLVCDSAVSNQEVTHHIFHDNFTGLDNVDHHRRMRELSVACGNLGETDTASQSLSPRCIAVMHRDEN